jgi:hypothetical protein
LPFLSSLSFRFFFFFLQPSFTAPSGVLLHQKKKENLQVFVRPPVQEKQAFSHCTISTVSSEPEFLIFFFLFIRSQMDDTNSIEKLPPAQQVHALISTLEKGGNVIRLVDGLENCYKTYSSFIGTEDHIAFKSERLVELILNALKTSDKIQLPSLLTLVKIVSRIGKKKKKPTLFFFVSSRTEPLFSLFHFLLEISFPLFRREY